MLQKSKIGVCMDHCIAYLLEEKNEEKVITIIEAELCVDDKGTTAKRRRSMDAAFFKKVFEIVKDFDEVLLYGPASAKREIVNQIKANKLFNIEIQTKSTSELITESQKIKFINNYFDN